MDLVIKNIVIPSGCQPAPCASVPTMSVGSVETVRRMETMLRKIDQTPPFVTEGDLHAGMYARTVRLPPGLWTGAQVKHATFFIIQGDALIYTGEDEPIRVTGYTVLRGSAGRKQAVLALTDIVVTAIAVCDAVTEAEAEAYMTDEPEVLIHRANKQIASK